MILWHFHDRFWYPSDEGIYANQAERIASGETLNVDVQDLHPGYGTFINAAALRLFGANFLSLRYPLVAAALLQSWLAFFLPGFHPWKHDDRALIAAEENRQGLQPELQPA